MLGDGLPTTLSRTRHIRLNTRGEAARREMARLDKQEEVLEARKGSLDLRAGEYNRREEALEAKASALVYRHAELSWRQNSLNDFQKGLATMSEALVERAEQINVRARSMIAYNDSLTEASFTSYSRHLVLSAEDCRLDQRAALVQCRRAEIHRQEQELDVLEAASIRRCVNMEKIEEERQRKQLQTWRELVSSPVPLRNPMTLQDLSDFPPPVPAKDPPIVVNPEEPVDEKPADEEPEDAQPVHPKFSFELSTRSKYSDASPAGSKRSFDKFADDVTADGNLTDGNLTDEQTARGSEDNAETDPAPAPKKRAKGLLKKLFS